MYIHVQKTLFFGDLPLTTTCSCIMAVLPIKNLEHHHHGHRVAAPIIKIYPTHVWVVYPQNTSKQGGFLTSF